MIKEFKLFENENKNNTWLISLPANKLDNVVMDSIPDITNDVKDGDIVLASWFNGRLDYYLAKVEKSVDGDGFGVRCKEEMSWYGLDLAWHVVNPNVYDKLVTEKLPHRDLIDGLITYSEWLEINKYNL